VHDAKTTALIKEEYFEAVRLVVHAGTDIPPHQVQEILCCTVLKVRLFLG